MQDQFEGVVRPVASLLVALGVPAWLAWLVKRSFLRDATRETLIEVLRKALDKGRVRENAYCSALEALVTGIDYLQDPPPALIAARARALKMMEAAQAQIISGGIQ